jgi:hypothetical protein
VDDADQVYSRKLQSEFHGAEWQLMVSLTPTVQNRITRILMNSVTDTMPGPNLRYDPAIFLDKMWRIIHYTLIWMISKLNC